MFFSVFFYVQFTYLYCGSFYNLQWIFASRKKHFLSQSGCWHIEFHPFLYIFHQIFTFSVSQLHKDITSLSNIDRSWKINKKHLKISSYLSFILIQVWMFPLRWKIKVWLPRPVLWRCEGLWDQRWPGVRWELLEVEVKDGTHWSLLLPRPLWSHLITIPAPPQPQLYNSINKLNWIFQLDLFFLSFSLNWTI